MESTVEQSYPLEKPLMTRAFLVLLLTQTCFGMSFSAFFLLPKYLKLALAATDLQIGTLSAIGAAAGVFAFPIVGSLNDRFGRKRFILLGSLLMTATAFSMLHIHEIGLALYAVRMAQGVAFALLFNSATTLVSDKVSPEQLGRALAVFGASMLATNALSPALSEWIADRYGWPWVFWLSIAWGGLACVCAPWVHEDARPARASGPRPSMFALLNEPRGRRIALLIAAGGAGFGTIFIFHQPYAISLGIKQVSWFFVAYAVFALGVRLIVIGHVDRWGRQRVSAIALLVYAIAVASAAWLRPGLLEAIGAIMGLAHGVFYPVFNALAIEGVALSQRGSMMALYHGGFNAGMAVALVGGGAIAERFGYPVLFWGMGTVTLLGAWGLFTSHLSASHQTPAPG